MIGTCLDRLAQIMVMHPGEQEPLDMIWWL